MRLLCLFALIASEAAVACIQPSAYTLMRRYEVESVDVAFLQERMKSAPASRLAEFDAWYAEHLSTVTGDAHVWMEMEQQALRDILTGRYHEAVETLLAIEASHPGEYATASTLGTAYELAGDNHRALEWIVEGIRRNPDSHGGTEWLHVDILEAKIAMERDPDYLAGHPIVPHPAAREPGLVLNGESNRQNEPSDGLMDALFFQLGERMLFVKPEDPVVADLLYSFARLEAARGSGKGEKGLLKLARTYGHPQAALEMPTLAVRGIGFMQSTWLPGVLALLVVGLVLGRKLFAW